MELLEDSYINDNIENGRITAICGSQGSGKSYFGVSFIKFAIQCELYDKIIFVCPTLYKEHSGQYDFMKNQKIMTLYEEYDDRIIENIIKDVVKEKILLVCDDASAYLLENKQSNNLYKLSTVLRHGKGCTIILLVHSLISVIYPTVRALINYLFIGNFGNMKLIQKIYEEYLSLYLEFKDFKTKYLEAQKEKHNLVLIDCKNFKVDWNVKQWRILNFHDIEIENDGKATIGKIRTDNDKMKEDILKLKKKTEMKNQLMPKKKRFIGI